MSLLASAMDCATPIGYVPPDYRHMGKLCEEAHMGYEDVKHNVIDRVTKKPAVVQSRRWFVVNDKEPYPRKRKTPTGRIVYDQEHKIWGSRHHERFCAILEYILFRAEMNMRDEGTSGHLSRVNILDVAAGVESSIVLPNGTKVDIGAKVAMLKKKDFRDVLAELGKEGMRQYATTTPKAAQAEDLPTLD